MSEYRPPWYAISRLTEPFKAPRTASQARLDRLTPEGVHNKRFTTTRLLPGYSMEEVDTFLDHVKLEMERLIRERDEAYRAAER